MATRLEDLLALVASLQADPTSDSRLDTIAVQTRLSPTYLQRLFTRMSGESPKRIATRIAIDRAAAALVTTHESIVDIALASGFESHEGFTRAFRRVFDVTPAKYRERGLAGVDTRSIERAAMHRHIAHHTAPCVGLYGVRTDQETPRRSGMSYTIEKRVLPESHILFMRKRVQRSEISAALGELLPGAFGHAMKTGAALAGPPLCRYREMSAGGMTLEAGVSVAVPATGEGDVLAGTLPAGPVVTTVHTGPYDTLSEAYAAMEQWMSENGLKSGGDPWEVYVTDPGEVPNQADWKTEINCPVAE